MLAASDVVLLTTACRRPQYLEQSLASWGRVRGVGRLGHFCVALGNSEFRAEQVDVVNHAAHLLGLDHGRFSVLPDSPAAVASPGMHRAIGEAILWIREHLKPAAIIFTEEDIEVSSDVLEYMLWALGRFAGESQVLTVCAHDVGGQGWDVPGIGARGGSARQESVQLLDYFNPWCWATWCDGRADFLLEHWDWDATKGPHPMQHGYDWKIRHLVHGYGLRSVVPVASRSQNIGRDGGVYARPELFDQTQAASYRPHRDPIEYKVVA
jgi:hypothetical protein